MAKNKAKKKHQVAPVTSSGNEGGGRKHDSVVAGENPACPTLKPKTKKKNKGGQPTRYKVAYNEDVRKLCLLGATDAEIGDFFGVTETTINNWKKRHPKFFESIKAGKIKADATIADSLYQRAKGYEHPDVHISNYKGKITQTKLTKYYPPDTAAAFIWLKNRTGGKFRDVLPQPPETGSRVTKIIVEYAPEYVPERKQINSTVIEQGE